MFTLIRLALRQTVVGTVVVAAFSAVFVSAALAAYRTGGGAGQLMVLAENPGLRALLGVPWDLSTSGGFVAWRDQMALLLLGGIWALLAATRLLRGAEELGLAEVVLAGRVTRREFVLSVLAAIGLASLVDTLVLVVVLIANGESLAPSLLFGLGIGLSVFTIGVVGALWAQLVPVRRRAAGLAAVTVGVLFVLRMAADATTSLGWLRWVTPFGWVENLRAFDTNNVLALLPLVLVPALLLVATLMIAERRDLGAGLVPVGDVASAHNRLLGSPLALAWRRRQRELLGWGTSLLLVGLLYGYLAGEVVRFVRDDPNYRKLVEQFGIGDLVTVEGYLAMMALMLSLVIAAYAVVVVHGDVEDEESGRLDLVYSGVVTRTRWFVALSASTLVGAVVLNIVTGVGLAVGASWGSAGVGVLDALGAVVSLLPVVVLVLALSLAALGLRPRTVVWVGGGVLAVSAVVTFFGPAFNWPQWLLNLSPYDHIGAVPQTGFDVAGTTLLLVLSAAAVLLAWWAYDRRDLI